nr:hypothetical protein [Tanacetum cinerariifolium]
MVERDDEIKVLREIKIKLEYGTYKVIEKLSQEKVSQQEALKKFKWTVVRDHEIKVLGEVNVELESGKEVDIRVCESFGSFFLDVIKSLSLEYEHVAMNLTLLKRAQGVRSSNADALDSMYLLVSLYRTPQSRLLH